MWLKKNLYDHVAPIQQGLFSVALSACPRTSNTTAMNTPKGLEAEHVCFTPYTINVTVQLLI